MTEEPNPREEQLEKENHQLKTLIESLKEEIRILKWRLAEQD